jgi:oligopeptidase B
VGGKIKRFKEFKNQLLLLKIDMESGHSGASGRYDHLKEISLEVAFTLKVLTV